MICLIVLLDIEFLIYSNTFMANEACGFAKVLCEKVLFCPNVLEDSALSIDLPAFCCLWGSLKNKLIQFQLNTELKNFILWLQIIIKNI